MRFDCTHKFVHFSKITGEPHFLVDENEHRDPQCAENKKEISRAEEKVQWFCKFATLVVELSLIHHTHTCSQLSGIPVPED